jgi:aryl-alcohol dehydrogenase-like predicted oxidoreductase
MEYRNLGRSGLQVSVVGLGCNNFGWRIDRATAELVVARAIELGVTFFDTADVYGDRGKSEEYLSKALKPHRRNIVIGTKAAVPMGEGPYWAGASRRYLTDALEDSLRRLDTDYIDLYMIHRFDPLTPVEETLRTLEDMVRSGKVRYLGCSGYSAWQLVEAVLLARGLQQETFVAALREYSLLERRPQEDIIPVCLKYGIGLVPFYPLASGFLTGKYRPGQPGPAGARLTEASPSSNKILSERNFAGLARLEEFCQQSGRTMVEVALGWLVSQPVVSSVIAGATTPEQVEQNIKAGEVRFSTDELEEISKIVSET